MDKITCPKCKRSEDLIMEQPYWEHTKKRGENVVKVDCHCINCTIDFHITAHLTQVSKAVIDQEGEKYPY